MNSHRTLSIIGAMLTVAACSEPEEEYPSASTAANLALNAPQIEQRGYVPRACGFDMNRNGIIGEPADCDVCDGETTDPDGDGVDEDLIYVDADWGSDIEGDGGPWYPYKTIQYAWNVADGPRDGAEDIICLRGFAKEELISPGTSGLPGTYTVPRSGSQARDWQLPVDPTMLVGWDEDNDGIYPPFDPDDTAVLEGSGDGMRQGMSTVFRLHSGNDYLEVAHLYVQDYGRFSFGVDSGFIRFGPRGDGLNHIYFHDLELYSINKERLGDGGRDFTFNLFNTGLHWANFSNMLFEDNGGWFARGAGPDQAPDEGPLRWQNITRTVHSCDFSECGKAAGWPGFKIWGYISRIEILDSIWDTNVAHWEPNPAGGHGATAMVVGQCSQNWTIRNNEIIDSAIALRIQASSVGFCENEDSRPVDKVVFDRNIVRNSYGAWGFGNLGIDIEKPHFNKGEGDDPGEVIGDVTITNNFLSTSKVPWDSCIWMAIGNGAREPPGRIVIANNTCVGEIRRHAAIAIGGVDDRRAPPFQQQDVVIWNNIVTGLGDGQHNVMMAYAPENLVSDSNVFDANGVFRWDDWQEVEFGGWKERSGTDQDSRECYPAFEDAAIFDFHLSRTDTCAQGRGRNLSELTTVDVDGDPRPPVGVEWDVGADQVAAVASDEPPFRFAGEPSGVVPGAGWQVVLGLETNEAATCRWSHQPETTYGAMAETFSATGGKRHTTTLTDPAAGEEYLFHVRCVDTLGHANLDDFTIAFIYADMETGLAGHWQFEEGRGAAAADASGNVRHGSLVSNPVWRAGRVGGGLALGGRGDHVKVDPAAELNVLQAFTVAAWIKLAATGREQVIADKRDDWDDGLAVYVDESGRLLAYLNEASLSGSARLDDDVWHHVAAVYNGEELKLFVDGDEDGSDWMNAGAMDTEGELRIGGPAWDSEDPSYFAGVLDEVRLYDRPLGEYEVGDLSKPE